MHNDVYPRETDPNYFDPILNLYHPADSADVPEAMQGFKRTKRTNRLDVQKKR